MVIGPIHTFYFSVQFRRSKESKEIQREAAIRLETNLGELFARRLVLSFFWQNDCLVQRIEKQHHTTGGKP